MKKLILSCAVALTAAVSFTSCAKDACYECENTVNTVSVKQEVCDGQLTTTTGGTTSASTDLPGGISAADYRASLELSGYTCANK